ncbi:autotransporter adhesin, partial [Paraburkholderia sp. GAS448]|uniref:YadA family autotransporter adhesin n=1 Tax=Paraburkholderia sp. GAS448 TaxID=3035136 RepID=UPI003D23FBDE
ASSVDAVNGSQLFATNTNVTNLDNRVTTVEGDMTSIRSGLNNTGIGLVQQAGAGEALTVGKDTDGNEVNFAGTAGERVLSGVAAGTADTDAVNVSQLKASGLIGNNGQTIAAVTYDTNANGMPNYNSITLGGGLSAGPVVLTNVASGTSQYDAVNFGQLSELKDYVTSIDGRVTTVENSGGSNPYFNANDTQPNSGDQAVINAAVPGAGTGSTAAGSGATVAGNYGTAVGSNASAAADNTVAIGSGAQANAANSVALGHDSVADRAGSVSVGSAGNERQVTNVAAGTASTDAVNVGQLNDSIAAAVGPLPAGTTAKDYTDQRIAGVQNQINDVAKGAYSGVAAATALTMIP